MASRVHVEIVDDLDGSPAATTRAFTIDGVEYEIDLSAHNSAQLDAELARWQQSARRLTRRPSRSVPRTDAQTVREWARRHDLAVSRKGRIAETVLAAYRLAHPSEAADS